MPFKKNIGNYSTHFKYNRAFEFKAGFFLTDSTSWGKGGKNGNYGI